MQQSCWTKRSMRHCWEIALHYLCHKLLQHGEINLVPSTALHTNTYEHTHIQIWRLSTWGPRCNLHTLQYVCNNLSRATTTIRVRNYNININISISNNKTTTKERFTPLITLSIASVKGAVATRRCCVAALRRQAPSDQKLNTLRFSLIWVGGFAVAVALEVELHAELPSELVDWVCVNVEWCVVAIVVL